VGRTVQFGVDTSGVAGAVADWSLAPQAALGCALGLFVGGLMAAPQAWVLAEHVERPWRWIGARAAAWGLALPLLLVTADTWLGGVSSVPLGIFATVLAAFAVVAALVGTIEGIALGRIAVASTGSRKPDWAVGAGTAP
jgi:Ca2+/Na+ antiporter